MNRVGSLVFATATTALTGAAVVLTAGGSIFGQIPGAPSQKADPMAGAAIVRSNPRTVAGQDTPAFAVEGDSAAAPVLAANLSSGGAAGWNQGQGADPRSTGDTPPAQEREQRETPTSAPTATPSRPAATPTSTPRVAPTATRTPEPEAPPSFAFTAPDPTSTPKSNSDDGDKPRPATPTAPASPSASPTSPPASSSTPAATPTPRREKPEPKEENDD